MNRHERRKRAAIARRGKRDALRPPVAPGAGPSYRFTGVEGEKYASLRTAADFILTGIGESVDASWKDVGVGDRGSDKP